MLGATDMAAGVKRFLDAFRARGVGDGEPAWLADHRGSAMDRFAALGMPGRDLEAWRFTDLRPLLADPIAPLPVSGAAVDAATLALHRLPGPAHRVVLVNGRFDPALSEIGDLPPGAWIGSTADAVAARPGPMKAAGFDADDTGGADALVALNAGLFTDGFALLLDAGVTLEYPVEILHYAEAPDAHDFHMRNAVVLGAAARACLVETFTGAGVSWTNTVTRVGLADAAALRHVKIQAEASEAFHTATLRAALSTGAAYRGFAATLGGRVSRQDVVVDLNGEDASFALHGAYLLRGEQQATLAPAVTHHARNCRTTEVLKGVVDDRAHGVFLGAINVAPGADGTAADQLNRNLVLSRDARVDTKPELEIYADDVKCSHGATVGDLDEASLFYLLARGIEPSMARRMLIEAFVGEVIEAAELNGAVEDRVRRQLSAWFDPREGA